MPLGPVPTGVHVAHRGLFVVAVDVQHLLVRGLRLQLLHLLGSLLERGLGGRQQGVSEGKVRGAPRPPPAPRSPGAPRTSLIALNPPGPGPAASAPPPPPRARLTPRQTDRQPIAAPRAPRAPISVGRGRAQDGQGANAEAARVPPVHQRVRRQRRREGRGRALSANRESRECSRKNAIGGVGGRGGTRK